MDANEIIIKIKTLPPMEQHRIAKMMSPFAWASDVVMKLAELFHQLSPEEQMAFIEIVKCWMWNWFWIEKSSTMIIEWDKEMDDLNSNDVCNGIDN